MVQNLQDTVANYTPELQQETAAVPSVSMARGAWRELRWYHGFSRP